MLVIVVFILSFLLSKSTAQQERYFQANETNNYIQLSFYAFESHFKINLLTFSREFFLAPHLSSSLGQKSNCFFTGHVNEDSQSTAYIDLCQSGQISGVFNYNHKDYFIQPISEFDSASFKENEYSSIDFIKPKSLECAHYLYTQSQLDEQGKQQHKTWLQVLSKNEQTKDKNDKKVKRAKRHAHHDQQQQPVISHLVDRKIYLELLVVVDQKMQDYYGDSLENHVLAVLFLVTQLYQHPTLVNPIRIYITDIVYLSKLKSDGFEVGWEAEKVLNDFCSWQLRYKRQHNLRSRVDAAILLTKRDLCKSKNECQTLGMARLNQICVPGQNCAVIEDSGINTAFSVAHEIGHLIGMRHVDEMRCSDNDDEYTHMMSSMLDLTRKSIVWSNCSVRELHDFLRSGEGDCLFNRPERTVNFLNKTMTFEESLEQFEEHTRYHAIYPGEQLYEIKHQCQQIFGPNSDACDVYYEDDCKVLWCKVPEFAVNDPTVQCVTSNTKWADGTRCGLNDPGDNALNPKMCMSGECVGKTTEHSDLSALDGGWNDWSDFTPCSRPCGGGIKKRYRVCDNPPPKNGGRFCVGDRVEYVSCNTQDCSYSEMDYRDEQCQTAASKMNLQKISDQVGMEVNETNLWKAYYSKDPRRKCILMCKLDDHSHFAVLSPMVTDGTKCDVNSKDICVNGHCLPGGCDNVLYSKKSTDICGVCDGKNDTCEPKTAMVDLNAKFGYNYLVTLPAKSTNFYLHRNKDSDDLGCFAIRSDKAFILNGHYAITKSSTLIKFDNGLIDYLVNETDEVLSSKGNFSKDLHVEFLTGVQRTHQKIKYSFYKSKASTAVVINRQIKADKTTAPLVATTSIGPSVTKTACDRLCNGRQVIKKYEPCDKSIHTRCVNNYSIKSEHKICNTDCDLRVLVYPVGCVALNGLCGEGYTSSKIECLKVDKKTRQKVPVNLKNCNPNEVRYANATSRRDACHVPCNSYEWRFIEPECLCENGYKKPQLICYDRYYDKAMSNGFCTGLPLPQTPVSTRCDSSCYKWKFSDWSPCSRPCGSGTRARTFVCVLNGTQMVDSSLCDVNGRPESRELAELCNENPCPYWSVTPWTDCSYFCDASEAQRKQQRTRNVSCLLEGRSVDAINCEQYSLKSRRPHDVEECKYSEEWCTSWRVNEWSECSTQCGPGTRTRRVYCEMTRHEGKTSMSRKRNAIATTTIIYGSVVVDESKCNPETRPFNVTSCMLQETCAQWRTTAWSACMGDCNSGSGYKTRTVYCSHATGCSDLLKPSNYENCTKVCRGEWKASDWSECSEECNLGWRTRIVTCIDKTRHRLMPSSECPQSLKPERTQRCFSYSSCPGDWHAGNWTECSSSCLNKTIKEGTQTREVKCLNKLNKDVIDDEKCDERHRPEARQVCEPECSKAEWKIVSRGQCSVACGKGWRPRKVECLTVSGQKSNDCDTREKPAYYEPCDAGECPQWEHGEWSRCSVDCSINDELSGFQQRQVVCRNSRDGSIVTDENCNPMTKPETTIRCKGNNDTLCSDWIVSNWTNCDYKSCTRVRSVRCGLSNGTLLDEKECNKTTRPNHLSDCENRAECNYYIIKLAVKTKPVQQTTTSIQRTTKNLWPMLVYSNWSECSSKFCNQTDGVQIRKALCVSKINSRHQLPMNYCSHIKVESLRMACKPNCSYKLVEKWSQCSVECGKYGIEKLDRKCYEENQKIYTTLSFCGIASPSQDITRSCFKSCASRDVKSVTNYDWRVGEWSQCSVKCGLGDRTRSIECLNSNLNKIMPDSYCTHKEKPIGSQTCLNASCGHGWFYSTWSDCSETCSKGVKRRQVNCYKISPEGYVYFNQTTNRCDPDERPSSEMPCNNGDCESSYTWQTGSWSECSAHTCALSHQTRDVYCVDRAKKAHQDLSKCNLEFMPQRHQFCFNNCYVSSCSQLNTVFGITADGEYTLLIQGKLVSIYCKNMNSSQPLEYLTLKAGYSQNFAEIYDKKLIEPNKCSFAPRYGANCSFCRNETLPNHGITLYSKVRLNIDSLRVVENDFTFSYSFYGSHVPFGHSGDCFSSLPECQIARLNINLKGTGFVLDRNVKWTHHGEKPHSKVTISNDLSVVQGTCGGFCGFCRPDPSVGLRLKPV